MPRGMTDANKETNAATPKTATGEPADGMRYTRASAVDEEYRRRPLKVKNDDYKQLTKEDTKQVKDLMAAFSKPFKAEQDVKKGPPSTAEKQAEWTRFQL